MEYNEENLDRMDRFKAFRKETGMSQAKFCKYFGLNLSTMQDWEHGVNRIPKYFPDLLERVWKAEAKKRK